MAEWSGPREFTEGSPFTPIGPASWLVENVDVLPRGAEVLDVACGRGRNALLLAAAGFTVRAVDRDPSRIEGLAENAGRLGIELDAQVMDLEAGGVELGSFDLVLGFHYLHRPLFPALVTAVRPGGILLYETFTAAQAARGHPRNPAYLLSPGELESLVAPLTVFRSREGEYDGRMVSAVAARREPGGNLDGCSQAE
jgi:SAM-dependent methyltransferase